MLMTRRAGRPNSWVGVVNMHPYFSLEAWFWQFWKLMLFCLLWNQMGVNGNWFSLPDSSLADTTSTTTALPCEKTSFHLVVASSLNYCRPTTVNIPFYLFSTAQNKWLTHFALWPHRPIYLFGLANSCIVTIEGTKINTCGAPFWRIVNLHDDQFFNSRNVA